MSASQERHDALRALLAFAEACTADGVRVKAPTWAFERSGDFNVEEIVRRGRLALQPGLTPTQSRALQAVKAVGALWYWTGGYWLPEQPRTLHQVPSPGQLEGGWFPTTTIERLRKRGLVKLHQRGGIAGLGRWIGSEVRPVDAAAPSVRG